MTYNQRVYNWWKKFALSIIENRNTLRYEGLQFLQRSYYDVDNTPIIVVGKHLRYADYLLGTAFDEPVAFPGKEEIFFPTHSLLQWINPLGVLLRQWGGFPTPRYLQLQDDTALHRLDKAYQDCDNALQENSLFLVFPEGTTSQTSILYPKMGFMRRVIQYQRQSQKNIPVVPAIVDITPPIGKYNIIPKNTEIIIRIGEGHLLHNDGDEEQLHILRSIQQLSRLPLENHTKVKILTKKYRNKLLLEEILST